ncbi:MULTISPECIES: hypothetical protein [unclassified Spirosoma]|uniref:hypothetical protein n=1 Tax=unclassified Spirosoma TaxID=2621999 RepID=UPI0009684409|nr:MULTISPECIES: hypothetical protein [unclassified Spirosoma]MBN8826664.1 hypothetical protein [Spirosoma sp.]OJW75030.1 MAG: hypothetical protein BGO59_18815 [Spirosoma sp. 48-14]
MKTLHTTSIRTLLVLFTFILLLSSCSKNEPDPLDQYVGTWAESMTNGQTGSGLKLTISKSGKTLTLIDFMPYGSATATVSGSGFQADNKSIATGVPQIFPDNSQAQVYLLNLAGSLSGGNLTLTYTAFSQSATMNYKADVTKVFTKK